MPNIYKVVDTYDPNYPLVDGVPFNKFDAGAELRFQAEQYFPGMFQFEEISCRTGNAGMKESLLRCRFTPDETSGNVFYIYALEVESGGRSLAKEHRIQFRHNALWYPRLANNPVLTSFCKEEKTLEDKECYVIGISKSDINNHNVIFCSFYPSNIVNDQSYNIETQATAPKSIQVNVDYIQDAYINNISVQSKGNNFNVIFYKPQYLLWYMANRDELHLADIQTVKDMIKEATRVMRPSFLMSKGMPLQQIFYGAPGTGKSHEINEQTKDQAVIRTTFHPDSDYSTFVGAYKPVMDECDIKVTPVVVNNGFNIKPSGTYKEKRIVYKFVKQAFLKAYLGAWKRYANSKCNNATANNNDFETSTGGYYIIGSVETGKIILSRKFIFPKKAVLDEWKNLWNGNSFEVPEGRQSGKPVQHAIAKWIYNQIVDCSIDSFEDGWAKLMNDIKTLGAVDVKNKTTIYNLSPNGNNDEELIVKVEGAGKSRNNLKSIFEGKESSRKLDKALVDILKKYDNNFDVAWDRLKNDVRRGANTDEMEAPNADVEPQFLVIEEINRGNCAQIFGDLFQLLDRSDNGFSTYPIEADTDIQNAIKTAFEEEEEYKIDFLDINDVIEDYTSNYGSDLSEDVKEGRVLLLPPNLYIWATMNTSDQSLFPIDSAFKRRWDWVYVPIDTKKDNWFIKVGDNRYSWTDFLEKINNEILTDETAEDKHLGFYFCKAENKEITQETFVGKVLFYLWNDVFKVYGIPSIIGSSKDWSYRKFYQTDGKVDEQKVIELMKKLDIAPEGDNENKEDEVEDQ